MKAAVVRSFGEPLAAEGRPDPGPDPGPVEKPGEGATEYKALKTAGARVAAIDEVPGGEVGARIVFDPRTEG
ncbi:hypothetical protein [Streptomyces kebangsaanensis]|uniref:hypothetical protein n=1 Tax=Streptomyces kebangsaanensis TaxID=864058 RepID=UPI00093F4BC4|nr:hypothetical protein [Streptomyces kebangsaanensis]